MDDMISRQAAIDALTKHEIELPIYAPRETDVFWNDAIDCCVSEIEALPSAQQDVTDTNVGDMINRQAAISRAVTIPMFGRDIRVVGVSELESLPSAQPERKTGEWILSDVQNPEDVRNGNYTYTCSNCLHSDIHAKTAVVPFCWHCGADMGKEYAEEKTEEGGE